MVKTKITIESNADFLIFTLGHDPENDNPREACVALNENAERAGYALVGKCRYVGTDREVGSLRSMLGYTIYMLREDRREFMKARGFQVDYAFV